MTDNAEIMALRLVRHGQTDSTIRRVREAVAEIMAQHRGETIIITTRGGVIGRAVCTFIADESADWCATSSAAVRSPN